MSNLKKILALALALVMALSLMTVASASTFTDSKDVTTKFNEAVEVLGGMKVFQGKGTTDTFAPKDTITRGETAALIYRIVTGDVPDSNGKDNSGIYKDYNAEGYRQFEDVGVDHYAAGYIGYCSNGNYIKGDGAGHFFPNDNVTGYQVLAMLMRAVGYGQAGEFEGTGWEVRVGTQARTMGLLKNITDGTLREPATRETVAELIFRAIEPVSGPKTVKSYTLLNGYVTNNTTLGQEVFHLTRDSVIRTDPWGRPCHFWYKDNNTNSKWDGRPSADVSVATVQSEQPVATYNTAVTECQIAQDAGFDNHITNDYKNYSVWVNGQQLDDNSYANAYKTQFGTSNTTTPKYTVNSADVTTTVGARGRIVEVYSDRLVMIDTFLARITKVTPAKYDAAGHRAVDAKVTMDVYDGAFRSSVSHKYELSDSIHNDYTYNDGTVAAVGDMVLVQGYTQVATSNVKASGLIVTAKNNNGDTTVYGEVLGKAEVKTDAQTTIWYNAEQHSLSAEGLIYDDHKYVLNAAGRTPSIDFNWYYDQFGNLIGSDNIGPGPGYGVIKNIWWSGDASNGTGKTMANVVYMDGTEATLQLTRVTVQKGTRIETPWAADGTLQGTPGYADNYHNKDMKFENGILQVTPSTVTNAKADGAKTTSSDGSKIIVDNLFKFASDNAGAYTAIEVAGDGNNLTNWVQADGTTLTSYDTTGLYNVQTENLKKGVFNAFGANKPLLGDNTVFLIRSGSSYRSVTGYSNIGDYTTTAGNGIEVDFVKLTGSDYVDYVYINNAADSDNTMYGIFFYNGGQKVDLLNGTWRVRGWLDGEETDITIANATQYNNISSTTGLYKVISVNGVTTYVDPVNVTTYCDTTVGTHMNAGNNASIYQNRGTDEIIAYKIDGSQYDTYSTGVYSITQANGTVDKQLLLGNNIRFGEDRLDAKDQRDRDIWIVARATTPGTSNIADVNSVLYSYVVDTREYTQVGEGGYKVVAQPGSTMTIGASASGEISITNAMLVKDGVAEAFTNATLSAKVKLLNPSGWVDLNDGNPYTRGSVNDTGTAGYISSSDTISIGTTLVKDQQLELDIDLILADGTSVLICRDTFVTVP